MVRTVLKKIRDFVKEEMDANAGSQYDVGRYELAREIYLWIDRWRSEQKCSNCLRVGNIDLEVSDEYPYFCSNKCEGTYLSGN